MPCDKTCQHCQQAVISDVAIAYNAATPSVLRWLPIWGSIAIKEPWRCDRSRPLIYSDLPPPVAPPTLLNLHCALIA